MNVYIIASKYNSVIELGPCDMQITGDVCITLQGMTHNTMAQVPSFLQLLGFSSLENFTVK